MAERRTRGACFVRRRDVLAVIKAIEAAGYRAGSIEVGADGKISVTLKPYDAVASVGQGANEWDEVLS